MYQTVMTTPEERHLRRVLWRSMDTSREPDVYIITCNNFGSGPAGAVTIATLRYLADLKRTELPRAAEQITNQSYVDDLIDSVNQYDAAVEITKDVDTIFALGNFEVKKWTLINSADSTETSNATISDVLFTYLTPLFCVEEVEEKAR